MGNYVVEKADITASISKYSAVRSAKLGPVSNSASHVIITRTKLPLGEFRDLTPASLPPVSRVRAATG